MSGRNHAAENHKDDEQDVRKRLWSARSSHSSGFINPNQEFSCPDINCNKLFPNKVLLCQHLSNRHKDIINTIEPESESSERSQKLRKVQGEDFEQTSHPRRPSSSLESATDAPTGEGASTPLDSSLHLSPTHMPIILPSTRSTPTQLEANLDGDCALPIFLIDQPPEDKGNAALLAYPFYINLQDSGAPVFPQQTEKSKALELDSTTELVLGFCCDRSYTCGEARDLYDLLLEAIKTTSSITKKGKVQSQSLCLARELISPPT